MSFPTPQGAVISYLGCCMPDANLEVNNPEWFEYDFIFNQYGFPNLSLSYVKPTLEWLGIAAELVPPPTDPDDFPDFLQKVAQLTANLTLPSMQAKTLLDLKFPTGPGFNFYTSLDWLLSLPFPSYDIEFEGGNYQAPNLKQLVFGHFTVKFNLFLEFIIGPLKKPEMPKVPTLDFCISKINTQLNLPSIPLWQLQSPDLRIQIPAVNLHLQSVCNAKFFVDAVKALVGG